MDKSKYFLDLSKCTEEQVRILEQVTNENINQISEFPLLFWRETECDQAKKGDKLNVKDKKEVTYPEFIKLFDGGEGENNGWISAETKPNKFQDVILYREDAGVFMGYYGNLAETLSEMAIEQYYNEGVSEETMWKEQFFYFGIEGNGILELDTEPTHWMPLPEPPKF